MANRTCAGSHSDKPAADGSVESFKAKFRYQWLNEASFTPLAEALAVIGQWRQDENARRSNCARDGLISETSGTQRPVACAT